MLAWFGGGAVGVANGVLREVTYGRRTSENAAHQISVGSGIAAFAALFWALERRWPIASARQARTIGSAWLGLTVAFEFAFGRLVAKQSWRALLADYNLARGRLWPLVLGWLAVGPAVARRAHARTAR